MADRRKKRSSSDLLSFDRGDDWARQQREEEEKLRLEQEEERRRNPPDFSGVTGSFRSAPEPEKGILDSIDSFAQRGIDQSRAEVSNLVGESLFGGAERSFGGGLFSATDNPLASLVGQQMQAQQMGPLGAIDYQNRIARGAMDTENINPLRDAGERLFKEGSQRVEQANKFAENDSVLPTWLAQGTSDVFASPSSFASLPGGAFAAIPAADVFGQEYTSARLAGLDKETATARASAMAGIEGGISTIPTFGALEKFGYGMFGKDLLRSNLAKVAGRTLATGTAEAAEEMVTTAGQIGVDKAIAAITDDEKTSKFSNQNTVDFFNQVRRAGVAGFMGGSGLSAPGHQLEVMSEAGKIASDALIGNQAQREYIKLKNKGSTQAADTKARLDAIEKAKDEAFTQREQELGFDPQQKADEMEAGFRTLERQGEAETRRYLANPAPVQEGPMQAALNRMGPLPVKPVTPQEVAAEREPAPAPAPVQEAPAPAPVSPERAAAEKLVAASEKDSTKKAKAKRGAARRKAVQNLLDTTQGMSQEERITAVQDGMAKWESDNPLENFMPKPKATPAPKPVTTTATEPVEEETTTPEEPPKRSLDELKKELGMPSGVPAGIDWRTADTGNTAETVLNTLVDNVGGSDAKKVLKMIGDKKMVVVNDHSELPNDVHFPPHGAAYQHNGKTYIVANRISKQNLMGELLGMAAHEAKHGADLSGNPDTRKGALGSFIGKSANDQIIRKVEALAANGNPQAQRIIQMAKQPGTEYELELPAYLINWKRQNRDNNSPLSRVVDNVVSAVRTKYKSLKGDGDINFDDVAYLSDRLLEATALTEKPLTDGGNRTALPMIMGKNAPLFEAKKKAGLTYKSVDGNEKFVMTDADAELVPDPISQRGGWGERLEAGENVPLTDILEHDLLYTQYPQSMDLQVRVDPELNTGDAALDIATNTITVSKDDVRAKGRHLLRENLMHEIQHAVQDYEGHSRGGNSSMFNTSEDKELYENYNKNQTRLASMEEAFANKQALNLSAGPLSDKTLGLISDTRDMYKKKNLTRLQYLAMVSDAINEDPNATAKGKAIARQVMTLVQSGKNLGEKMNARAKENHQKYERLLGEQEARYTQLANSVPQHLLDVNPEEAGGFDYQNDKSLLRRDEGNKWWVEDQSGKKVSFGNLYGDVDVPAVVQENKRVALPSGVFKAAAKRFTEPDTRATRVINKSIKVIASQLKTYGNLGHELGEMKENADGEAALHSHNAMNYFTWLNRGIDRMARAGVKSGKYSNKKEGKAAVTQLINDQMDKIAALPDATRREAALAAFVRNNPELDGLREAVQEVNQLSRTLLKQLIQTHPNPTPDQLRLMNTIMDNSFRYTTQMYAAFQGPAGRVHSQNLIDNHDRAQKILDKGGQVPSKLQEDFTTYKNALDYLIKNDLNIPARHMLDSSTTEKLAMLYDTWVGDATQLRKVVKADALKNGLTNAQADQLVRDTMAAALEAKKPGIQQADYEGKARDLMMGMLELTNEGGPFASYYRGFKQDRSILEQRTGLPPEIQKLFGKITDPATRLAVTIAKQGELASRTKMLLDMRDNGTGKWVIPPQEAGLPGKEKFSATLKGENFGPLNGYRTTPEIAAAISDNLEMFSTLTDALAQSYQNTAGPINAATRAGVAGLKKVAAWQKISSVVFDLYNMGTNFMGSLIPGIANGVINPKTYWNAAKTGMDVVIDSVYTKSGHLHPRMADAIRYGVLDSARVQEIRKTPQKYVKELISVTPKAVSGAVKPIKKAATLSIEAFAMSDAWVKIAAFEDRYKHLDAFYKAEGIQKSEEDIKREAADTIKDTNITYTRTPTLVRNLESIGLTTFMPYFVSVPRAITFNYVTAIKDFIRATDAKTPKGKALMMASGAKRMAGASLATYGTVTIMKAVAAAINGDDEDKVEQMKKLMFPDARFSDSFYLGKSDEGNPMFARFSRIDPFGPTTDFMRIAMDDEITPEEKRKHMWQMFKDLVITNRVLVSAAKLGVDLAVDEELKDKDTKLEKISGATGERFKELLQKGDVLDHSDANSVMQLLDSFTPGFADMFDPKNRGVSDPKSPDAKALSDMIMWSGGRLDVADPGLGAFRAGKEVKEARDSGKDRLAKALQTGRSAEEMRDIFLDAAAKEHAAMREAAQVYEGMTKGLGLTPRQAAAYLKDDADLTQSDIANIRNGKVNQELEEWLNDGTRILSKDALKKREGQQLTEAEQKELKKTRKEFLDEMKALGYKVRENNK